MNFPRSLVSLVFSFMLFAFQPTQAQSLEVYAPGGKAIHGYDPVAFFADGKPVAGQEQYSYQWMGATWLFSTAANLDLFKTSPEKYAPQYGGYCAFGTADGHKAPTKPETWTINNGKLYFNYNLGVKKAWDKDRLGYIQKADANWPTVKVQH